MKKARASLSGIQLSGVEQSFIRMSDSQKMSTNIPYITVDNFPRLGLLTALRFLEWTRENPGGVISLPTGKTPEFFIKWTKHILDGWNNKSVKEIRDKYGLRGSGKPDQ